MSIFNSKMVKGACDSCNFYFDDIFSGREPSGRDRQFCKTCILNRTTKKH